jgi:hypothetical protein
MEQIIDVSVNDREVSKLEFKDYNEYQKYLDNNYEEEDQLTIESFISYYMNKENGYGHLNCEYTYQDDLKNDITGKLHEIAMIGFNLCKRSARKRKEKINKVKKN